MNRSQRVWMEVALVLVSIFALGARAALLIIWSGTVIFFVLRLLVFEPRENRRIQHE